MNTDHGIMAAEFAIAVPSILLVESNCAKHE